METNEWKTLLQIKKEVSWKWMDPTGFNFDVKASMKDQNSITFLQATNRITLERTVKVDLNVRQNLLEQGNPIPAMNIQPGYGMPTPYQPPIMNNQIQLVDQELKKNIDGGYQQPTIEKEYAKPMMPNSGFNYPSQFQNENQQLPSAFEPYIPKIDEITRQETIKK